MRLEPEMWSALLEICQRENCTVNEICTQLEKQRGSASLTGALRVHVLVYFTAAATEAGHGKAGHGKLGKSSSQP